MGEKVEKGKSCKCCKRGRKKEESRYQKREWSLEKAREEYKRKGNVGKKSGDWIEEIRGKICQ